MGTYRRVIVERSVPLLVPASCGEWLKVMPARNPFARARSTWLPAHARGVIATVHAIRASSTYSTGAQQGKLFNK